MPFRVRGFRKGTGTGKGGTLFQRRGREHASPGNRRAGGRRAEAPYTLDRGREGRTADRFEEFCATHLSHLDEVVDEFFASDVALGAVIKHSKDWNLARESVIGSGLSLRTPAPLSISGRNT